MVSGTIVLSTKIAAQKSCDSFSKRDVRGLQFSVGLLRKAIMTYSESEIINLC